MLRHMSLHSGDSDPEERGDELPTISAHSSCMARSSEGTPLLVSGIDTSVNMVSGEGGRIVWQYNQMLVASPLIRARGSRAR